MAVINGPSSADGVVNDTTGDDVINLSGQATVLLSGGNDRIVPNYHGSLTAGIKDGVQETSLNVGQPAEGGLLTGVYLGQNSKIGTLTLTQDGNTISMTGVSSSSGLTLAEQVATQVGGNIMLTDRDFIVMPEVQAKSLYIDGTNATENTTPMINSVAGDIDSIHVRLGQNGADGFLSVNTRPGVLSVKDLVIDTVDMQGINNPNRWSFDTTGDPFHLKNGGSINVDLSKSAYRLGTTEEINFYQENASDTYSLSYRGSAFNDFVDLVADGGSGKGAISTGEGDDFVYLSGKSSDSSMTVDMGVGEDNLIAASSNIAISAKMGADADMAKLGNGNDSIDMGASGAANTGNVTFRINAYSSLVNGVGAHASIYAGGKKIGEFQANNNATTGQDFTITTAAANLTNGEFAILFDNDAYIAATSTTPAQDRNLYIREVEMITPDGSKQMLWNKAMSTDSTVVKPLYDQYNSGAPAGVNSAFDGQNLRTYTPYSTGTIGMAWGGALKFNLDTQVAGIDIADGGNGSDTYLFDRNSGRDRYRDTGTQAGDVDVLKFSADVKVDQIWLSRDAQAKIHVGIIGTNNDAVINGVDQLQAGGKTLAAADFDKLIQAMASVTPPTMGQLDLNTTQHQKLDTVIAANWH